MPFAFSSDEEIEDGDKVERWKEIKTGERERETVKQGKKERQPGPGQRGRVRV